MTSTRYRTLRVLILAFLTSVLSDTIAEQAYAQSVRYRDEVFTNVDRVNAVAYGAAVNVHGETETLALDFYEPAGDTAQARPLVVFVHGGGWNSGTRDATYIVSIGEFLVRTGYVFASVSYRLDTLMYTIDELNDDAIDVGNPSFPLRPMANAMHDVRAALRYFRKNADVYRIDTTNVFLGGDSAGGYTSLLVAYNDKPEEIPLDAVPRTVDGDSGNPGYASTVSGVWLGCSTSISPGAIEPDTQGFTETPLIAAVYVSGDPFVFAASTERTISRTTDLGMTPAVHRFENGTHCSWLVPATGELDLITYAITLKDALYNNLSSSTGTEKDLGRSPGHQLSVYPNPFKSRFTFTLASNASGKADYVERHSSLRAKLYNMQGRIVGEYTIDSDLMEVDTSVPNGVYLLVVSIAGSPTARQVIVRNR